MKTKTLKKVTKAQFTKMNRYRRRVFIAKDVLAQLASDKYVSTNGTYFRFTKGGRYIWQDDASAQEFIQDSTCHVCAKGAAVCSYVRHFNERTTNQLDQNDPEIVAVFGKKMWDVIEAMFEGFIVSMKVSNTGSRIRVSFPYYVTMESIMQNIVDNKGKLKFKHGANEYIVDGDDVRKVF